MNWEESFASCCFTVILRKKVKLLVYHSKRDSNVRESGAAAVGRGVEAEGGDR